MQSKISLRRRTVLAMATALVATGVPAPALVINTNFSSNVTSLPNSAEVEAAFGYAVQQYEDLYSNPITININVDTETSNYFNSNWGVGTQSYSTVLSKLSALSATSDQITAAPYLPSSDPTGGMQWDVPLAEEKALGLRGANDSGTDGTLMFNPNLSYTYDPYDRAVAGEYDFIGFAEHEISEIMGRGAGLGFKFDKTNPGYIPFDLYRYSAVGFHNLNASSEPIYFSIDGGVTNLREYNYTPGDDLQDWTSTPADSYDAVVSTGAQNALSDVDTTVMDVLGYNRASNFLTWNGGTHDFLTGNNWSSSSQSSINPYFGAFLYMGTVSAATHAFAAGENYMLSSNSDMGQTVEISQGAFIIGLSGSASPNTAGLLVNQDGLLLVDTNGTVDVAADLSVGDAQGVTNGLVELFESGQLHVGTFSGATQVLFVGNNGTGQLYQEDSSDVSTPALRVGEGATGNGSYFIQDSSKLFVNGDEIIGDSGTGTVNQNGGTQTISGTLSLGNHIFSQGTMTMTSGALTAAVEQIGVSGTGTLTQQGGNQTISNYVAIAAGSSGTGGLTVSGGTLQDNGSAYVGGGPTLAGGTGNLQISGGAMTVIDNLQIYSLHGSVSLSSGSLTVGALTDDNSPNVFNWSGGTLHLTEQPLDITGGVDPNNANPLGGTLTLGNGQTLQVDSTESLSGSGASVTQNAGSSNTCSTLQIGSITTYSLTGGTLSTSEIDLNTGGTFTESSATVSFTTFNQTGGSATFNDGLALGPAVYNLSGGTLTTTGSGEKIGYLNLATGNGGVGTFNQTGGTHTASSINIGFENTGTYNLGKSSILNVTGAVNIGEFSSGSTFTDDGAATVGSLFVFGDPQTVVTIDGGSLTSGSTTNFGTITQTSGSSNLGALSGSYGTINIGDAPALARVPTKMIVTALQQGTLNIQTQGLLQLTGGTNNVVDSLNIGSGYLDLTDSSLFIDYGSGPDPIASIAAWIESGYANGLWNGIGIMSSTAQDNPNYGIGYADSADPGNPAGLPSDTIEIKYTLLGDANLDGTVNSEDFTRFSHNLSQSGMTWDDGDFNYDGTVNTEDFTLFSHNLNQSAVLAGVLDVENGISFSNVPEPASCAGMITMAGLGILRRRRRSTSWWFGLFFAGNHGIRDSSKYGTHSCGVSPRGVS